MVRYYIDTVPIEAADNLLKVQSSEPQFDDWISWVPLRVVITLMGIRAEWARSLKSRFKTLEVGKTGLHSSRNKTAVAYEIREAHDFILAGGGEGIKEIQVNHVKPYKSRWAAANADDFQKLLPNVTSLSINSASAMWYERFRGQIDKFFVRTGGHDTMRALEKYCTKLRSLKIISYCNPTNGPICDGSANTLQSLDIFTPLSNGQIKNLQKKFRQLKRISIRGDVDAVTGLIVSYGGQLEWAALNTWAGGFKEADLRKITSVCVNAFFRWNARENVRTSVVAGSTGLLTVAFRHF